MNQIFEFLKSNYSIIISSIVALLGAIISILSFFRKRRSSALSQIVQDLPSLIRNIELVFPSGFGEVKLDYVLKQVRDLCSYYGYPYDSDYFLKLVESILSTPQKK